MQQGSVSGAFTERARMIGDLADIKFFALPTGTNTMHLARGNVS